MELKSVLFEKFTQFLAELAAEDLAERFDGQEESARRVYPSGTIKGKAAGGNDVVYVGMKPSTPTIPRARKIRMSKSSIHSTRSMVLAFKSSAGRSVETARCLSPIQLGGG